MQDASCHDFPWARPIPHNQLKQLQNEMTEMTQTHDKIPIWIQLIGINTDILSRDGVELKDVRRLQCLLRLCCLTTSGGPKATVGRRSLREVCGDWHHLASWFHQGLALTAPLATWVLTILHSPESDGHHSSPLWRVKLGPQLGSKHSKEELICLCQTNPVFHILYIYIYTVHTSRLYHISWPEMLTPPGTVTARPVRLVHYVFFLFSTYDVCLCTAHIHLWHKYVNVVAPCS